jgi:hypothetical protein
LYYQLKTSKNEKIVKHQNVIETNKFNGGLKILESFFNPFNILLFAVVIYNFVTYFAITKTPLGLTGAFDCIIYDFSSWNC